MSIAKDRETILEIASKIKEARLNKDLKQMEVAQKAELNPNYYAKVERGEAKPSVLTLTKILKALGIKSSDILSI